MPKFRVTGPDGSVYEVNAPDGATEAQAIDYVRNNMSSMSVSKPAAVQAGDMIRNAGRQAGLFGRYALESAGRGAEIVSEPLRYITDRVTGQTGKTVPAGVLATRLADTIGLPSPEGADERVVADATRTGLMAMGMAGGAKKLSDMTAGAVKRAASTFAQQPVTQAISGAAAGGAGSAVKESGGGPGAQFLAALGAGVATPLAAQKVGNMAASAGQRLRTAFTPQAMIDQQVNQQISLALRQAGIDWNGVANTVKTQMRDDVAQALAGGGQLDSAAAARLLQMRMAGITPTRGMVSQDPIQITKEMNLAKVGANSTDIGQQQLPQLQSRNTATLLSGLDNMGASGAPDDFATGQQVLRALRGNAAASKARIDSLYSQARDTAGRSAELDTAAFSQRASQLLDEANVGSFLTPDIRNKLNAISSGKPGYELNVDAAEQLKTSIAALQRGSTNGNERRALGLVRQALEETPLRPAATVNPGNLPAVAGTVPPSPSVLGAESIAAFNRARQANRAFMQRVENTPALAAALDDAQPDRFVKQFIIGQGATVNDLSAMRRAIGNDPQALQAVRGNILGYLRSAATGQADDLNLFRADSFNNALKQLGDRKLSIFFDPQEISQLRAIGNSANYMTKQPAGTAVNNSNSGALLAAKAMQLLDSIAGKLPLGLDTTIQGVIRGVQRRSAMQAPNALRALGQPQQRVNPLLALPVVSAAQE